MNQDYLLDDEDDDEIPTKEVEKQKWEPDWWFWIITAIIVMAMIAAAQNKQPDYGPGTPDIKGLQTMVGTVRQV